MALGNTKQTYGCVSRGIHWLTVLALVGVFGLAWADKIGIHKSFGVTVLALGVLRIVWTLTQPAPVALGELPRWQHIAAKATHGLLMLWLVAMPLSGWAMSSAYGRATSFFGLFELPMLVGPDRALGGQFRAIHEPLAYVGLALIALHVAGALWHHFILKDATLVRMLPCRLANYACGGHSPRAVGADVPKKSGGCGCGCGGH